MRMVLISIAPLRSYGAGRTLVGARTSGVVHLSKQVKLCVEFPTSTFPGNRDRRLPLVPFQSLTLLPWEVRVPVPAGLPSPGTELESPSVGQPHLASRAWLARALALVRGYCKRSHWEVTAGPSIFLTAY